MNNKKILSEAGRWVRVSVLTASTFGPIVGTVLTRLREQQVSDRPTSVVVDQVPVALAEETYEKPSLSDSLAILREHAYNQELVHRAEDLAEELRQRAGKLSSLLAERGSDLTHELGKRSSDLSHELGKRSNELTHELGKQSEAVGKKLRKQTRKVSRSLTKQENSTIWIISGFTVGLIAASIAAFILIRNRLVKQQEPDEDEHILLAQDERNDTKNEAVVSSVLNGDASKVQDPATLVMAVKSTKAMNTASLNEHTNTVRGRIIPADAAFLGIASTKRYYPVQTPLDQLSKQNQPLDIIYFSSEEEAKAQGFTSSDN